MPAPTMVQTEVVSYMPDAGILGYFLLGQDDKQRWYWGETTGETRETLSPGRFHGPLCDRGEAIVAGEDWVAETVAQRPL